MPTGVSLCKPMQLPRRSRWLARKSKKGNTLSEAIENVIIKELRAGSVVHCNGTEKIHLQK